MNKSLHTVLTELKATLRTLEGGTVYELSRKVLDQVQVTGYGTEMRLSALDALDNVLDAACNSGTVENLFELQEVLMRDTLSYGSTQDGEGAIKLVGELFNHCYVPEYYDTSDEPLQAVLDAWNREMGEAAEDAVRAYVAETFPEYNF